VEGFLVFDKPPGITSHDVVAMLRAVLGIRKIGHTGTLDPFATGVLAIAIGSVTRLIQYLDEDLKVYDSLLVLGQATETGDPEGEVILEAPVPSVDSEAVRTVLRGFSGQRMQKPPMYSAVKVNGRPLYSYARAGETVDVPSRPIRVDGI
jgi:tRNA pseudouridine55 synthase